MNIDPNLPAVPLLSGEYGQPPQRFLLVPANRVSAERLYPAYAATDEHNYDDTGENLLYWWNYNTGSISIVTMANIRQKGACVDIVA